jgi:hypothetical protein
MKVYNKLMEGLDALKDIKAYDRAKNEMKK